MVISVDYNTEEPLLTTVKPCMLSLRVDMYFNHFDVLTFECEISN